MNIGYFAKFREETFSMSTQTRSLRDSRQRPQIPISTIYEVTSDMVPFGLKSLLQVDQLGRTEAARRWYKSDRALVVSDTTIERCLRRICMVDLIRIQHETVRGVRRAKLASCKLPSGREVKLGIVDGSEFGGFYATVLVLAGKSDAVVDLEMCKGRGDELRSARRMLKRVMGTFGRNFFDVLATDGLYMVKEDFRTAVEEYGCHLVVKTEEETLEIIQDARELFFATDPDIRGEIERVCGTDVERGCTYEILCAGGFRWEGLECKFKVALVREIYWKPKDGREAEETFWVITTDETLSAEDMRELAHRRWIIENHLFRRLNSLVKSKRRLTKDPHVREALLRIWMTAITQLGAYLVKRGVDMVKKTYRFMKVTWEWVTRLILGSLWQEEVGKEEATGG